LTSLPAHQHNTICFKISFFQTFFDFFFTEFENEGRRKPRRPTRRRPTGLILLYRNYCTVYLEFKDNMAGKLLIWQVTLYNKIKPVRRRRGGDGGRRGFLSPSF
jgi:hypothetical protein